MINRKIELVLIIISIVIFFIFGISGANILMQQNDQDAATASYEAFIEESMNSEQEVTEVELPTLVEYQEMIQTLGTVVIAIAVIATIVGAIAIAMLKGNKRPKPAGILLLIVGVLISFLNLGIALLGSLLYVIAGMMAVLRKPKYEAGS